jgi:hypothetical protein
MRTRSPLAAAALAAAIVAGLSGPAFAHEEINPKTFPTGQPTFFKLTAANEQKVNLVKIVLHAPAGTPFGETTRAPVGWTVTATDDTITWTGGAVKPGTFDEWGFEIDSADQPGTLAYKVTLGFADGKTDDVEVDVNAVTGGATGGPTAGTPVASTVTTGGAATSTTTARAGTAAADSGGSDSSGTAKAALAVSVVALLAAAGALAVGARRRTGGPAAGGGGGAGAAQDW